VSLTSFLFFTSFYVLLPTIPIYSDRLGGSGFEIGLTIGAVAVTSFAARPFVGWRLDRSRRLSVLFAGAVISIAITAAYGFSSRAWELIALRALHGVGIAAFATASSTLVADIAPLERRGEVVGLYGVALSLGLSIGPPIGMFILDSGGFSTLFATAVALNLAALVLAVAISEPARESASGSASARLLNLDALPASLVIMFIGFTYGPIASFLPIFAASRGVDNPGLFFTAYATAILILRMWTGKLSDALGRRALMVPGILAMALGLEALAFSSTSAGLIIAGAVYGLGGGALYPAAMALAIDRAHPAERGSAMATYAAAWDLGMAAGASGTGLLLGWLDLVSVFSLCGAIALLALVVFFYSERLVQRRPRYL